jgi:hypothetical protein
MFLLLNATYLVTNTYFMVCGFTWPSPEPMIYPARGEHTNNYTTDAVKSNGGLQLYFMNTM